jgi:hypothetical protein
MRDPKRIPEIIRALHVYWERYPDLRLGQLVIGLFASDAAAFYSEDDVALAELHRLMPGEWVACQGCSKKYLGIGPDCQKYQQACDCAASTFLKDGTWQLSCSYGSQFDMNRYRFRSEPDARLKNAKAVCDICIASLLEHDAIELIGEDTPAGFMAEFTR